MRKSQLVCISLLAIVSLLLASCTTPSTTAPGTSPTDAPAPKPTDIPAARPTDVPAASPTKPPAAAPATIKLWIMPNGADPDAAIKAEIAGFNKLHPDVTVEYEIVGWGDAYGRIQTAVQGGEGPCVTQLGTTWVPTFGTMGGLREFSADEIKGMGGADGFVQASWSTASIDGKTVAVPWFADVRAIAYRKDILEKINVKPEDAFKDMESFYSTLQKIKDADLKDEAGTPIAPFVHPGRNDWNVWQNSMMFAWAYGGDILSADGKKAAFNSDAAVEGITAFDQLYGKGLTSADTLELNSSQADARFGEGTAATYLTGPWVVSLARNTAASGWVPAAAQNLAFAEFPKGKGGQYTFIGGSNLAIMKTCKSPDAALAFVQYVAGKESQIRYANAVGMLPATLEGQNDPSLANDPLFGVMIKASAKGKTNVNIPAWGQVENNLQTALQGLWEDVAANGVGKPIESDKVKARLDEAANTVNDLLAK